MKKGFTLIELLIVVAIIAILAAIAVPNFLEAQVRSKVSRSKADQRTLATGIEAYRLDHNNGPSDTGGGQNGVYRPYGMNIPAPNFSLGFELTTPISYLASIAPMVDVFKAADIAKYENDPAVKGRQYYNFINLAYRKKQEALVNPSTPYGAYPVLFPFIGDWCVMGAGPDKFVNNVPGNNKDFSSTSIPRGKQYDATNGTVSNGDIYRSQKFGDGMAERGLP